MFFSFIFVAKVSAMQVYVGVQITTTEKSGGGSFDLLAGTELNIWDGAEQKGSTKILEEDVSVGETVWLGLVDLENGSSYTVKLETPLCFGMYDVRGPYCWYEAANGQNCNDLCAEKGSAPESSDCYNSDTGLYDAPCCNEPDENCEIQKALGHACATCYDDYLTGFYFLDDNFCLNGSYDSTTDYCDWSAINHYTRTCACEFEVGFFSFPFTASF